MDNREKRDGGKMIEELHDIVPYNQPRMYINMNSTFRDYLLIVFILCTEFKEICWDQNGITHYPCLKRSSCDRKHPIDKRQLERVKEKLGAIPCKDYLIDRCRRIYCGLYHLTPRQMIEYLKDRRVDSLPKEEIERIYITKKRCDLLKIVRAWGKIYHAIITLQPIDWKSSNV